MILQHVVAEGFEIRGKWPFRAHGIGD